MARQALTETPVNLVTALSLTAGTKYLAQAVTNEVPAGHNWTDTPVYLKASAASPTEPDVLLNHWEKLIIEPSSAMPVWAWCPVGARRGSILVSEAAT